MPLNIPALVAGLALGDNAGLGQGDALRAALPAAILPNMAMGVAVSEILIQREVANEPLSAGQAAAAPTIDEISPGSAQANTPVTISGANLTSATIVKFGATPVNVTPDMVNTEAGTITVNAPSGPAADSSVEVTVTGPGGPSNSVQFTYTADNASASQGTAQQPVVPAVHLAAPESGHYHPGDVIKADPVLWQGVAPDARPRFQWFRNKVEVERDGHSDHYKVRPTDKGCKLQVQVLYGTERAGYVFSTSNPIEIPKTPMRRSNKSRKAIEEVIIETV